ncbi:unnamed protein product, partial [Meganyctiphanes norvegica]
CPEGFINLSSQCFKMYKDSPRSWYAAKTMCEQEGYILAQPDDSVAVQLKQSLYEEYGDGDAWLGVRGDASKFVWAHGGLALDNASPLWYLGQLYLRGTNRCLLLVVGGSDFRDHPTRPYWSNLCYKPYYALCE